MPWCFSPYASSRTSSGNSHPRTAKVYRFQPVASVPWRKVSLWSGGPVKHTWWDWRVLTTSPAPEQFDEAISPSLGSLFCAFWGEGLRNQEQPQEMLPEDEVKKCVSMKKLPKPGSPRVDGNLWSMGCWNIRQQTSLPSNLSRCLRGWMCPTEVIMSPQPCLWWRQFLPMCSLFLVIPWSCQ